MRNPDQDGRPSDPSPGDEIPEESYTSATIGRRCVNGVAETWLVLSRQPQDCAKTASSLDADHPGTLVARVPDGLTSGRVTARACPEQGGCKEAQVHLALANVVEGSSARGRWNRPGAAPKDFDATWCDAANFSSGDVLVRDLSINEIALYQGIEIPLARDGNAVSQLSGPIVANRPALVRVFVEPSPSWRPRTVLGRMQIEGRPEAIMVERQVTGASTRADLTTTLNFDVPAAVMEPGLKYQVSLLEAPSCTAPAGTVGRARFPASGTQSIGSVQRIGALRVVLVPIAYGPDGSNRLPDTSPDHINQLRAKMFAFFPLADIDLSVRAPITTAQPMDAAGTGWTQLVDALAAVRQSDAAPADTYYYGMVQPRASFAEFCGEFCIAGLAVDIPAATDEYARAAIGLGYADPAIAEIFPHEIAHLLGRSHSPCGGAAVPDPAYPYTGGATGTWGYNLVSGELKAPDTFDFMGYCPPSWVSDYTYSAMFERLRAVTRPADALTSVSTPKVWRSIIVDVDSSLSWGHRVERTSEPSGTSVAAVLLDAAGAPVGRVDARFASMTHVAGGIIFIEEPSVPAFAISIEGFGVIAF